MKTIAYLLPILATCMACNSPKMNRLELQAVDMGDGDYSAYYVPVDEPLVADERCEDGVKPAFSESLLSDDFQLFPVMTLETMVREQLVTVVRLSDRDPLRSQQIVDQRGKELLAEPVFQISSLHSAPSGRFVTFSCKETASAAWSIWIMNADGTKPRLLTFGKDAMWVNDNLLVFSAKTAGRWSIQQCDANGGGRHTLVSAETNCTQPRVSPDGQAIAYVQNAEIWSCTIAGKKNKQLTTHPARDDSPVWADDGKILYFRSTRNGHWGVWQVRY